MKKIIFFSSIGLSIVSLLFSIIFFIFYFFYKNNVLKKYAQPILELKVDLSKTGVYTTSFRQRISPLSENNLCLCLDMDNYDYKKDYRKLETFKAQVHIEDDKGNLLHDKTFDYSENPLNFGRINRNGKEFIFMKINNNIPIGRYKMTFNILSGAKHLTSKDYYISGYYSPSLLPMVNFLSIALCFASLFFAIFFGFITFLIKQFW